MDAYRIACARFAEIGPVWMAASDRGIARIALAGGHVALVDGLGRKAQVAVDTAAFKPLITQLKRFASGRRTEFGCELDLGGTPFQRAVWRAISTIPWGETRSYAWVAAEAGRPAAVRAAAQACGANPVPILIPCHRVIASDGSLGGFSGGLDLKRRLLAIEGIQL